MIFPSPARFGPPRPVLPDPSEVRAAELGIPVNAYRVWKDIAQKCLQPTRIRVIPRSGFEATWEANGKKFVLLVNWVGRGFYYVLDGDNPKRIYFGNAWLDDCSSYVNRFLENGNPYGPSNRALTGLFSAIRRCFYLND